MNPEDARDPVILKTYHTGWRQVFEREARMLRQVLAPYAISGIEHVGSTAIVGMTAKPVVDIMVGTDDPAKIPDRYHPIWSSLGYQWGHEDDDEDGWLFFIKRNPQGKRLAHIHVVPFEGPFWSKTIKFRDALRADPKLVEKYRALKIDLASKHVNDRLRYLEGKAPFVDSVISGPRSHEFD